MAYDPKKVIDIALAQEGYLEKATNDQLDSKTANAGRNNYTKYARDLWAEKWFNSSKTGVAWCSVFVSWCFYQAYGKEAAMSLLCQPLTDNCAAGCKYARNYFKAKGRLFDTPQPGDQIFFGNADNVQHTGLVYKVDGSKVYTIEGNTSGASGVVANGGGVCRKSYALTNTRIYGYGRPAYGTAATSTQTAGKQETAKEPEKTATTGYTLHMIQKGETLWGIAKKYYGKGSRYVLIQQANGMKSTKIIAGNTIRIPKNNG